jgi:PAS domain S-box-containing protein
LAARPAIRDTIPDSQLADATLRNRIAELEAIYASAPIGIAVLDRALRFVRLNGSLAALNELPVEAHVGRTLHEVSPALADAMEEGLRRVFETGEALVDHELRGPVPGAPERERVCRETVLPIRDANGDVSAVLVTARDITDQVLADAERRRAEARFELALEAAGAGAYEHDGSFAETYWTGALFDMFGLPPSIAPVSLEKDVLPRIAPECLEATLRALADATASDGRIDLETRIVRDDGTSRWIHAVGRRMGPGRRMSFGVVVDVTAAKEREAGLEEALRRKQVLFDEANHRIKNNLQLVMSLLSLQAGSAASDVAAALKQAMSRVNVIGVLHNLMFRLEDVSEVDLSDSLGLVCNAARDLLDPSRVSFSLSAPSVRVTGDIALPVSLVVNELVTNAAKYAFPGERRGSIEVIAAQSGDRLEVEVRDDGIGHPVDTKPGLGTQLVQALCHQAQATLERLPTAQGSAFRLDIPLRLNRAAAT